jgi:hypothetical protein
MEVTSTCSTAVLGNAFCSVAAKFEFVRGVQRVAVDDDAARPQRAKQDDGVLQQVGHHERHAVALAQALRVQPRGEITRQRVQLGVAERLAHADVCRFVCVPAAAVAHHRDQRGDAVHLDLGRNAGGVALVPDSFHLDGISA